MQQTANYKNLLKLAGPLILGNLSQMVLGIMDSLMVGKLGYKELAASSLALNIVSIPFVCCIGLLSVLSPLVAFKKSSQQEESLFPLLVQSLLVSSFLALIFCGLAYLLFPYIHRLKQDPDVIKLSKEFIFLLMWSIVPMVIFLCLKQFCDGLGKTRFPLWLSLLSIPMNFILNYCFIYGNFGFPSLGLVGSGLATLITRISICLALFIFVFFGKEFKQDLRGSFHFFSRELKEFIQLGLPSSWQYTSEVAAFVVLGIMAGNFGAKQQAAHQIALSCATFTFMISMGISTAGSIKVGESIGSKNVLMAEQFGKLCFRFALYYGCLCGILFIVFHQTIPRLFNSEPEVIQYCSILFLIAALFQISDSMQAVGVGLLRGLQDTHKPTLYTSISYWLLGIPSGTVLAYLCGLEVYGLWLGFVICLSIMAILLYFRFKKMIQVYHSTIYGDTV